MNIPKGILFDVDRTLTRQDKTISPRTIAALQKAAAAGLKLGLCTGRLWSFLKPVLACFPAPALHVIAGGGLLVDTQGTILESLPLSAVAMEKLWTLTQEPDVGLITGVNERAYATLTDGPEFFASDKWRRGVTTWRACRQCQNPALVIVRPLSETATAALTTWQAEGLLTYKTMQNYTGELYADVTAPAVTKASMARVWARYHGLDLSEVAAVGDGINDLEVIAAAGLGVAMGNGVTELKQLADLVIGETDADGLAVWLEETLSELTAKKDVL